MLNYSTINPLFIIIIIIIIILFFLGGGWGGGGWKACKKRERALKSPREKTWAWQASFAHAHGFCLLYYPERKTKDTTCSLILTRLN